MIHIDCSIRPVAIPPVSPVSTYDETDTEPDVPGIRDRPRITIGVKDIGRVVGPPPWSVNPPGIIDGHIDDARIGGFDPDGLLLDDHALLMG
jgi:hypothetical protein